MNLLTENEYHDALAAVVAMEKLVRPAGWDAFIGLYRLGLIRRALVLAAERVPDCCAENPQ